MESTTWKVLTEWSRSSILTYSVYSVCAPSSQELLLHQSFILCLLFLLVLFAWSSRHEPVTCNDGANLLTAVSLICPVFVSSVILCEYFTDAATDDVSRTYSSNRDIVLAVSMLLIAYVCLITIFMPIMYTIHKYGEWSLTSFLRPWTEGLSYMQTRVWGPRRPPSRCSLAPRLPVTRSA